MFLVLFLLAVLAEFLPRTGVGCVGEIAAGLRLVLGVGVVVIGV